MICNLTLCKLILSVKFHFYLLYKWELNVFRKQKFHNFKLTLKTVSKISIFTIFLATNSYLQLTSLKNQQLIADSSSHEAQAEVLLGQPGGHGMTMSHSP